MKNKILVVFAIALWVGLVSTIIMHVDLSKKETSSQSEVEKSPMVSEVINRSGIVLRDDRGYNFKQWCDGQAVIRPDTIGDKKVCIGKSRLTLSLNEEELSGKNNEVLLRTDEAFDAKSSPYLMDTRLIPSKDHKDRGTILISYYALKSDVGPGNDYGFASFAYNTESKEFRELHNWPAISIPYPEETDFVWNSAGDKMLFTKDNTGGADGTGALHVYDLEKDVVIDVSKERGAIFSKDFGDNPDDYPEAYGSEDGTGGEIFQFWHDLKWVDDIHYSAELLDKKTKKKKEFTGSI